MAGKLIETFLDKSRERSTVQMYIPDLDDTNVNGYTTTGVTPLGEINTAINALTLCVREQTNVVARTILGSSVTPTDNFAQRELGLRFFYQDTVSGKKYHFTIPGPTLAVLAEEGTDEIDPENVLIVAAIAAFEANLVSEMGNPIEITHVRIVGRFN